MLFFYRILINLVAILSPIIIFFRLLKKKEDPIRYKEKFCFFNKKRSKGKLIWFHGASVGEILSVIPLIEQLEKDKKINQILITSNTLSSSKIISNLKLKKTVHQFFPIDTNYHSQKFLDYWSPAAIFFIDSEIWPNMITKIENKKIPLILLNARISKKTFKRWLFFSNVTKNIFGKFNLCLAANNETKKNLKILGAKKIKYIGNLKFSENERDNVSLSKNLLKYFSKKRVWCASSTHYGEEKFCALVHKQIKKKYKNLITIIIPRHIDRIEKIKRELLGLNFKVHTHSLKRTVPNDTDFYLVDSYGKTKSFFKTCKTVFLGGSIIKHGGQNPLEAARYGCKILHGPNIWNFNEIYKLLNNYKVSNKINNINEMVIKVDKLIGKKTNSKNTEDKIKKLGNKILYLTIKEINFIINKK